MQTAQEQAARTDRWLVSMGWGIFLVGAGALALLDQTRFFNLAGWPMLWAGLIMLGVNGARYVMQIKMSKFTLGMGLLFTILGAGTLVGFNIPFFPLLLIVIGVGLLLEGLYGTRLFRRNKGDVALR